MSLTHISLTFACWKSADLVLVSPLWQRNSRFAMISSRRLPADDARCNKVRRRQLRILGKIEPLTALLSHRGPEQRRLLEIELEAVGMRLNRKKPDVVVKTKVSRSSLGPTDHIDLNVLLPRPVEVSR